MAMVVPAGHGHHTPMQAQMKTPAGHEQERPVGQTQTSTEIYAPQKCNIIISVEWLWELMMVQNVEPTNPPDARLKYLDAIRVICVFLVVLQHFSTMTDQDDIMDLASVAGDAVVVPGLFFVSGAVFAETSHRQISRKMEEQGHVTFCQLLVIHWGSAPKIMFVLLLCLVINVIRIALNQGLLTDAYCDEYDSTSCRANWDVENIIFHSWYLVTILVLQAFWFCYSASRAYMRGSLKWWICYACQLVLLTGTTSYFAATNLMDTYHDQHLDALIGYVLTHVFALGLTMLPSGSRIAFFVYIGGLWLSCYKYGVSNQSVESKGGFLTCLCVFPGYFAGMLSREDGFLCGWPRRQFAAYMWYPMFVTMGFMVWIDPLSADELKYGASRTVAREVGWKWVGQLLCTFVFYACGFEEMMRHVEISKAHVLSSVALYAFHPLVLQIAFVSSPYYWRDSSFWYVLLLPWIFHGSTLAIMASNSLYIDIKHRAEVQSIDGVATHHNEAMAAVGAASANTEQQLQVKTDDDHVANVIPAAASTLTAKTCV